MAEKEKEKEKREKKIGDERQTHLGYPTPVKPDQPMNEPCGK